MSRADQVRFFLNLQPAAAPSRVAQFYALTKPRVVQLIVFCALIGMLLALMLNGAIRGRVVFRIAGPVDEASELDDGIERALAAA